MGIDIGPRPNDPTEEALWYFVGPLNYGNPHPYDDDRFYKFIVVAHQHGSRWDRADVEKLLIERYCLPEDAAERFSRMYAAGRKALLKQERIKSGDDSPVY